LFSLYLIFDTSFEVKAIQKNTTFTFFALKKVFRLYLSFFRRFRFCVSALLVREDKTREKGINRKLIKIENEGFLFINKMNSEEEYINAFRSRDLIVNTSDYVEETKRLKASYTLYALHTANLLLKKNLDHSFKESLSYIKKEKDNCENIQIIK
jgi:hypothetical protein